MYWRIIDASWPAISRDARGISTPCGARCPLEPGWRAARSRSPSAFAPRPHLVSLRTALLFALSLAMARSLAGQGPPPDSARRATDTLSLDSLVARLARAEAAISILRQ